MTTDPLNAEALAAAVNRLRENLDSFDREMAFEVESGGERADLWTDIDVGVDDLRTLLDALPSVQTKLDEKALRHATKVLASELGADYFQSPAVERAIRAYLEALPAPSARVTVKPLEWEHGSTQTKFGSAYSIHRRADGMYEATGCGSFVGGPHDTFEAAQAAAQADYEARILSALAHEPAAEWRDIESAPRDGTKVVLLLSTSAGDKVHIGHKDDRPNSGWHIEPHGYWSSVRAWIPLPPPPEQQP